MKRLLLLPALFSVFTVFSQSYTSYFTGNSVDLVSSPTGGVCMMGGATEHDEAMKWFLQRANGGDVLVLRASGSNGYNDYLYTDLGITINSVETIVFNNSSASNETYIHDKIKNAEAIWFAGGDQWNYISYWRDSPIDSLINDAMQNRNIVIGGTSAGMAILGKYYFSAENGTVTSDVALSNPYDFDVTVDSTSFLKIDYLEDVITDSHYDSPDRKGRHVVFMARILTDYGMVGKGIACNEYTSVCIDENGLARVFGDFPNYPETAYFIQPNCELLDMNPENCTASTPLEWNLGGNAIKVYKINGNNSGNNSFSLADWETGTGGNWEDWYVDNGTLVQVFGPQIACSALSINSIESLAPNVYPNPFEDVFYIESESEILSFSLLDLNGMQLLFEDNLDVKTLSIDKLELTPGMYFLNVQTKNGFSQYKLVKK